MVKSKRVVINNTQYIQSYSDEGKFLYRDDTLFFEAIDPIDNQREYVEVDVLTDTQTPYEINRKIAEDVKALGGINTKLIKSDKDDYDLYEIYLGDVFIKKEYVIKK